MIEFLRDFNSAEISQGVQELQKNGRQRGLVQAMFLYEIRLKQKKKKNREESKLKPH